MTLGGLPYRRTNRTVGRIALLVLSMAISGWLLAGVARAAAPVNTATPMVSGTPEQGQPLTLTQGTWTDATAVTVTDQWQRCTAGTCSDITGATGTTYTQTAADVGRTIEVAETGKATDGSLTVNSPATGTVTGNSAAPTITGTAQQGQTLTLHQGTWTNSPTSVADQWEDCLAGSCTPIAGATLATYAVTLADVGHTIEVVETATNAQGPLTATSAATATVVPGVGPTELSAPLITGTMAEGNLLTLEHGTWSPTPTLSDQWYRCTAAGASCTAITGAVSTTYLLTAADVGTRLLVIETARDAAGTSSAPSALTGVLPGAAPVNTAPPVVSGQAQEGQTLVASTGSWSGNPSAYGYQWERCRGTACSAIAGATGQTYTAGAGDVGQALAVLGTATNAGGTSAAAASAHTAVVVATSTVALIALPEGPTADQTVTLVATVSSGSGNVAPAGSMMFMNGSAPIPNCANEAFQSNSQSITLICQTSFAAGARNLGAVYRPGAASFLAASAAELALNVGRDSTSMSLAVTRQVSRHGRAVYRATVVLPSSNSGPVGPTGSVEFLDRGRPIPSCLRRPLKRLSATCTMKYKAFGQHSISARYGGDGNFSASRSSTRMVRIVRGSPGPLVRGFVSSVLQWQFKYHPRYTQVTTLRADALARGMTIVMGCDGGGCPFTHVSIPVGRSGSVNLLSRFDGRRLAAGTRITLWMTRPHWVGKYYSFTVRSGQGPEVVLSCLGVGSLRPGVGC